MSWSIQYNYLVGTCIKVSYLFTVKYIITIMSALDFYKILGNTFVLTEWFCINKLKLPNFKSTKIHLSYSVIPAKFIYVLMILRIELRAFMHVLSEHKKHPTFNTYFSYACLPQTMWKSEGSSSYNGDSRDWTQVFTTGSHCLYLF